MVKYKALSIILLGFVLLASCSFVACGGTKVYDITAENIEEYLWDNCFHEVLNCEVVSCSHYHQGPYIWFSCILPNDKTFDEVKPILEELKIKVLERCSDKSFEPYNTFLTNSYYTIYVELVNPRDAYPNNYPRKAGLLRILTEGFPIKDGENQVTVTYY